MWWEQHSRTLPLLSKIAKTVFTIPCSSAKSERTFSCAGNFATKKRNRLGNTKLEDLVILKENKKTVITFKSERSEDLKKTNKQYNLTFNQIKIRNEGITDDEDPIDHSLLHDSDLEDLDSDEEDNDVTFIDDDDNDADYVP